MGFRVQVQIDHYLRVTGGIGIGVRIEGIDIGLPGIGIGGIDCGVPPGGTVRPG